MKIDILLNDADRLVRTYDIADDLRITDFLQWTDATELRVQLSVLLETVQALTQASEGYSFVNISVFLPLHVMEKMEHSMGLDAELVTALHAKLLLLSVAREICHNHVPLDAFRARIYE